MFNFTSIFLYEKRKIFPKNYYILKFNGSVKGNPAMAAASAVLYKNETEIWAESKVIGYQESNNFAECTGLIMGLTKAIDLGINDLIVENSSIYMMNLMNGKINVKPNSIKEIYKHAIDLKMKFPSIIFRHIFRKDNQRAIELCNEEIDNVIEMDFASDKFI
jgi:ribonuclease HI